MFIDFKGKTIHKILVNGKQIKRNTPRIWENHRIYIPYKNQKVGQNQVVIEFESYYVNDCQGFQYFKDDKDGSEYVYTELEPAHCHIVFPCFDQPDLKAAHKTCIIAEADWEVITNSENISKVELSVGQALSPDFKAALKRFGENEASPLLA